MTKRFLTTLTFLFLALQIFAQEEVQEPNPRFHSRPSLKLGFFMPADNFGYASNYSGPTKALFNSGFNFQFGNHIYIGPAIADKLRFGLDVSWIDLSFASAKTALADEGGLMHLGFVGVGPLVSFSPIHDIAIDTYLKGLPTYSFLYTKNTGSSSSSSVENSYYAYSVTAVYGIAFRWKVLTTGLEFNWGEMDFKKSTGEDSDPGKLKTTNTRLYIGVQF